MTREEMLAGLRLLSEAFPVPHCDVIRAAITALEAAPSQVEAPPSESARDTAWTELKAAAEDYGCGEPGRGWERLQQAALAYAAADIGATLDAERGSRRRRKIREFKALVEENARLRAELSRERDLHQATAARGAKFEGECHSLRAELEQARSERDKAFDRGRSAGREDIGKYSNAIGRIEAALGIAGAQPLRDTVAAAQRVVQERDAAVGVFRTEMQRQIDGTVTSMAQERDAALAKVAAMTNVVSLAANEVRCTCQPRPVEQHHSSCIVVLARAALAELDKEQGR